MVYKFNNIKFLLFWRALGQRQDLNFTISQIRRRLCGCRTWGDLHGQRFGSPKPWQTSDSTWESKATEQLKLPQLGTSGNYRTETAQLQMTREQKNNPEVPPSEAAWGPCLPPASGEPRSRREKLREEHEGSRQRAERRAEPGSEAAAGKSKSVHRRQR